jgi:hypothetical protein
MIRNYPMKPENIDRKTHNTSLRIDVIRKLKILSAETDLPQNRLIEEALTDLFKKYEQQSKKK